MKTNIHFLSHLGKILGMRSVFDKSCRGNLNTHFMLINFFFFFENRAVRKIMLKNTVESDRPQMTVWRMRIVC